VADGRLERINVEGFPTFFSDLGVVSLKGRSFSPMAQFAVDALAALAKDHALV
jgi:hypothetical protein